MAIPAIAEELSSTANASRSGKAVLPTQVRTIGLFEASCEKCADFVEMAIFVRIQHFGEHTTSNIRGRQKSES